MVAGCELSVVAGGGTAAELRSVKMGAEQFQVVECLGVPETVERIVQAGRELGGKPGFVGFGLSLPGGTRGAELNREITRWVGALVPPRTVRYSWEGVGRVVIIQVGWEDLPEQVRIQRERDWFLRSLRDRVIAILMGNGGGNGEWLASEVLRRNLQCWAVS